MRRIEQGNEPIELVGRLRGQVRIDVDADDISDRDDAHVARSGDPGSHQQAVGMCRVDRSGLIRRDPQVHGRWRRQTRHVIVSVQ